mmetsp:Transcript_5753/g.7779  ORF Transcript_5753/g.7779 Transcript_5753/m.7779 type:complete len:98 (+) Transcript_5753:1153-1446(+)
MKGSGSGGTIAIVTETGSVREGASAVGTETGTGTAKIAHVITAEGVMTEGEMTERDVMIGTEGKEETEIEETTDDLLDIKASWSCYYWSYFLHQMIV